MIGYNEIIRRYFHVWSYRHKKLIVTAWLLKLLIPNLLELLFQTNCVSIIVIIRGFCNCICKGRFYCLPKGFIICDVTYFKIIKEFFPFEPNQPHTEIISLIIIKFFFTNPMKLTQKLHCILFMSSKYASIFLTFFPSSDFPLFSSAEGISFHQYLTL